jgi:hypothetical protein
MNDTTIRAGDVVVSRTTDSEPTYLVGTVVETLSEWVLDSRTKVIADRKSAIRFAHQLRTNNHRVWLFDRNNPGGADYVEVPRPEAGPIRRIATFSRSSTGTADSRTTGVSHPSRLLRLVDRG